MKFYFIYLIIIISSIILCKIENICLNDDCLYENKLKIKNKNFNSKEKQNKYKINNNKPNFFSFVKDKLKDYIYYNYYDYIDGFLYIYKNIKSIYQQSKRKQNIEQLNKYRNLLDKTLSKKDEEYDNNSNEKNDTKNSTEKKQYIMYPFNNSDLTNNTNCQFNPSIKANVSLYFCNFSSVNKEEYELLKNNENFTCEYYNNIMKICICPITYYQCSKKSKLNNVYCSITYLNVNNKTNLIKYRNTFYYEYYKKPYLNQSENLYNFNMGINCSMEHNESYFEDNYYLKSDINKNLDWEFIDMIDNDKSIKNYTKEDFNDRKNQVLDYFIKNKRFAIYEKMKLTVSFIIYEMMWVLPYRKIEFDLDEEETKNILNGNLYEFQINLKNLLENKKYIVNEIYISNKFPKFTKGDLFFYEINLFDRENDNIVFFRYQGEIYKDLLYK
jgi:hypothetical protein